MTDTEKCNVDDNAILMKFWDVIKKLEHDEQVSIDHILYALQWHLKMTKYQALYRKWLTTDKVDFILSEAKRQVVDDIPHMLM